MKKISTKKKMEVSSILAGLTTLVLTKGVQATEGDGGAIKDSKIVQGFVNMIKDGTATLRWVIPVVGIFWILIYVVLYVKGDEHEQQRYKKSIGRVLVGIIAGVLASSIVNLIMGYFV